MQHKSDREHTDETHRKPEYQRGGEHQLSKKYNRPEEREVRQQKLLHEDTVKLEGRASRLLLCPVLQTAGQRQRQFPQHALEPHAADQNTHHADANVPAGALRRIVLPVLNGDSHAGEHQYPEQGKDQKAPTSEVEIVARRRGQELPSVGERIFWHARSMAQAALKSNDSPKLLCRVHGCFATMDNADMASSVSSKPNVDSKCAQRS